MVEPELPQSRIFDRGAVNPPAAAFHLHRISAARHLRAQLLHAVQAAGAIGAGRKITEPAGPFRQGSQQRVTVRDTFVARQAQRPYQVACRLDGAFRLYLQCAFPILGLLDSIP